jgi:DNA-binding MarR family transcriptional regulator
MLDAIGDHPGVNMTEFAREIGVTKGAVSQIVKKLESKGFVKRFKGIDNNKDVLLELTSSGKEAYLNHRQTNDVTISVLEEKMNPSSDENIEFLIDVFTWIGDYLEQSREMMKKR